MENINIILKIKEKKEFKSIGFLQNKIESEKLVLDEKTINFYIIDIYEGVKEEVSLKYNILLLWHDYKEEYEEWFQIIPNNSNFLEKYISSEIGILTLLKNSQIYLAKRYYRSYNKISELKKINIYNLPKNIVLPKEDIYLDNNLLEYIPEIRKRASIEKIQKKKSKYNILDSIAIKNDLNTTNLVAA